MTANAPVGGLYIDVKLDAKQAMAGFDALKQKGTDVITSLGAVSSGISKAIAAEVAKSEKELQRLGQIAQQQAQIVNQALQKPKTPKTPLGAEIQRVRSDIRQAGISRDFINDLAATGDVAALQKVQGQLASLRKAAETVRVNAIDPQDIAEADKLVAKIKSLEAAARKATDKATGVVSPKGQQNAQSGLNKTTQAAKQTTRAVQQTTKSLDQNSNSASNVAKAALGLGANLGGVVGALKTGNIGFAVNYLFTGLSRSLTTLGTVAPPVAAALLAGVAAGAAFVASAAAVVVSLKQIGTAGITAGNELQTLEIALEASLGTAGAERELGFLTDRAQSSVFDVKGLAEITRTLTAYNVLDTELRQGLVDTLITLGTVSGRTVDQLQFGAVALGQVAAQGVLRGQETNQLVNSLGVGLEVLQELPEYATKSNAELIRMRDEGLIPAAAFFRALEIRAAGFGTVAAKASQTVAGQLAKLREDLPTAIGATFLGAGVQEQLTNLLSNIYTFLSSIDFSPIANGFATLFKSVDTVTSQFVQGSGGNLVKLFVESLLPTVLEVSAQVVSAFRAIGVAVSPIIDLLSQAFNNFRTLQSLGSGTTAENGFGFLIRGIGALAKGLVVVIQVLDATGDAISAVVKTFKNAGKIFSAVFEAFTKALRGDFGGARDALADAFRGLTEEYIKVGFEFSTDLQTQFSEIDRIIEESLQIRNEAQRSYESPTLGRIKIPDVQGPTEEERKKLEEEINNQIKFYQDLAQKLEDVRKQLAEFTTRWFGFRSELERGFLGDTGFEATVDQIAGTGRKLIEILRGVGQFAVAADIERSTRRLIDLARLRDQFAEDLKAAEQKLDEAIRSRDDFAKRIREQSIAFVNAFKLEESEVERITSVAGNGVSGYLVSRTKEIKSFVAALRDRLKTLREFRANISSLAARGLDAGLLEQLVSAGPEQAGDVVKQLSQSGDGVIAEVNAIQKELGDTAEKYGDENARRFYQAGVDTAQAQADGIRFGLKAIQFAAGQIVGTVQKQIENLASVTGEIGLQAANALAKALTLGAQLGLLNVQVAVNNAARKAVVVAQLVEQSFQAAQRIENEYMLRVAAAQANPSPVGRAVGLISAAAFRTQQYTNLNNEIDRLANSPSIQVFIGQDEIDTIVRTEINKAQRASAVAAGTRR